MHVRVHGVGSAWTSCVLLDDPPVIPNNQNWVLWVEGNLGQLSLLHDLLLAESKLLVFS